LTKGEVLSKIKKPLIIFVISLIVFILSVLSLYSIDAHATNVTTAPTTQTDGTGLINDLLNVNDNNGTLELVLLITIVSLAPSLLILMTCFTRIIIVFSLLRNAMGTQQTPPNQVLVGLSLFLTLFIMTPVFKQMNTVAYQPYKSGEFTALEAASKAAVPLKEFMLKQTSNESMQF